MVEGDSTVHWAMMWRNIFSIEGLKVLNHNDKTSMFLSLSPLPDQVGCVREEVGFFCTGVGFWEDAAE